MYAFAQRQDTRVVDEPFYGHYLSRRPARDYHPGAEEVIASMSADAEQIIAEDILGSSDKPVVFFKMMTHHLVELDWSFMAETTNVILTREPTEMLPSYARNITHPSMQDVGYAKHIELLGYLRSIGQEPAILDGRLTLLNPERVLSQLCETIGIAFDPAMLSWPAGPRAEDGVWAKYWYHSIHRSTGFQPYRRKTAPFPEHLRPLLEACLPLYQQLLERAIAP
jgi:hypothetical protein